MRFWSACSLRSLARILTTNIRTFHENVLFLAPRRSLASLARAYWYNLYSHRFCPLSSGSLLHCLECPEIMRVCVCVCVCVCVWCSVSQYVCACSREKSQRQIAIIPPPPLLKTDVRHWSKLTVANKVNFGAADNSNNNVNWLIKSQVDYLC